MDEENKTQQETEKMTEDNPHGDNSVTDQEKKSKKLRFRKENKEEELQNKLNDLNDKYLRLFAEFDNYRKRTIKEKSDLIAFASEEMIISLLTVMDDFDRAVASFDKTNDIDAVKEGVLLIYSKLKSILEQKGLSPMVSKDCDFNTDFHEAITSIPATEDMKGKVVDEIEKGYTYKGKIIRYAKVVVGN